jgi:hypothetical protein
MFHLRNCSEVLFLRKCAAELRMTLSDCEEMNVFIHRVGNGVSLYNLESFV